MSFISNIFDWLWNKVNPLPRPKIYALIYYRLPVSEKEKILKQYRQLPCLLYTSPSPRDS